MTNKAAELAERRIETATLRAAQEWEKEFDRFVFCIDELEIRASNPRADELVDRLEDRYLELLEEEHSSRH